MKSILITTVISFFIIGCSQMNIKIETAIDEKIPMDSDLVYGKLENGLSYYIKENRKPENRAELLLIVNTGSIMEDDDQQGLAHFCEHMAFNGTKRFPKQDLVDYLESIGMKFGPDLNAYTSFDETVYMLQIPTNDKEKLNKGFEILEDWAHRVEFENEEIDKERGVVIEEWRLRNGARQRMLDKKLPVFFKGSKYAERMPIGKKKILESFDYNVLKSFYKDWYRPDLMAVVAVGDFDVEKIKTLIYSHFSNLKLNQNRRPRITHDIPDHKETYFVIATDPEATMSSVGIQVKLGKEKQEGKISEFRIGLIEKLFTSMIDSRLQESLKIPDTPLIYGYSYFGSFVRHQKGFNMSVGVKPGMHLSGLEMMLTELERVKQFGFTQTELDRQKAAMITKLEKSFNERDKMESEKFKWEYRANFLENKPVPSIEWKYEMTKSLLTEINLIDISYLNEILKGDGNRVIYADSPEQVGLIIPDEKDMENIYNKVKTKDILPFEDKVVNEPLVSVIPKEKGIKNRKFYNEIDINEIILENNVRILYKKTDFKNDEILMKAYSPGGTSLYDDNEFISAYFAADFQLQSGIGAYSKSALDKFLADKIIDITPFINELQEGFDGICSPKDFETMLQIIYQYFYDQNEDSTAFEAYFQRYSGYVANRSGRPETVFYDSVNVVMNNQHFRSRPISPSILNEIEQNKLYSIFNERFSDASDFTFVFTGMIDENYFLPLVQKYLGNLPNIDRKENWKDVGKLFPKGEIKKAIFKGLDPKSMVQIRFSGDFDWSRKNRFQIRVLSQAFRIKLREILREEMGGTYGVWTWASPEQYPRERYQFGIGFGCAPENVKSMISAVYTQIDSLKQFGLDESYLYKVKESIRMEKQKNLKENKYWLNAISTKDQYNEDFMEILNSEDLISNITSNDLIHLSNLYLDKKNVVQIVLYPEDWKE